MPRGTIRGRTDRPKGGSRADGRTRRLNELLGLWRRGLTSQHRDLRGADEAAILLGPLAAHRAALRGTNLPDTAGLASLFDPPDQVNLDRISADALILGFGHPVSDLPAYSVGELLRCSDDLLQEELKVNRDDVLKLKVHLHFFLSRLPFMSPEEIVTYHLPLGFPNTLESTTRPGTGGSSTEKRDPELQDAIARFAEALGDHDTGAIDGMLAPFVRWPDVLAGKDESFARFLLDEPRGRRGPIHSLEPASEPVVIGDSAALKVRLIHQLPGSRLVRYVIQSWIKDEGSWKCYSLPVW